MADVNFDEDEFADLYDDDDTNTAQPESTVAPLEPPAAPSHTESAPEVGVADNNNTNGAAQYMQDEQGDPSMDYSNGDAAYQQGGNGVDEEYNNGYGNESMQQVEDNEASIGIKEDG